MTCGADANIFLTWKSEISGIAKGMQGVVIALGSFRGQQAGLYTSG